MDNNFEAGLVFGKVGSNQPPFDGGIFYNVSNTPGGMQFRNKGGLTRMVIHDEGNISMGSLVSNYKLYIQEGSSTGVVANSNSTVVIDKAGTSNFVSVLSDNNQEAGILFGVAGATAANVNGGILYNNVNNRNGFQFRTGGNSTKMSINDEGNVGIGTLDPQYRLHVATNDAQNLGHRQGIVVENTATGAGNTGEATISFKNAGPDGTGDRLWFAGLNQNRNMAFGYGTDFNQAATHMVIDSTGKVGIGTVTPAFQLQLSENSAAKPTSSSWTIASDARLKKNMHKFSDGLNVLNKINPIWFTYTGEAGLPNETGVGTTAQAIQAIAPYMVKPLGKAPEGFKGGGELLGVDYGPLQFIMVNAIKEQQAVIAKQQDEIEMLKQKMTMLQEMIIQVQKEK
jgi:Chaperone of endosialidase